MASLVVRVRDFGLVRRKISDAAAPAHVLQYLSPEQVLGEACDHRADVYGLGALMFRMLVGRPPYTGKYAQVSMQHKLGGVPRLRSADSSITPAVELLVQRALARDPKARYESMTAFRRAIAEIEEHGFRAMPKGEAGGGDDDDDSAVFYSLDALRGQLVDAKAPRARLAICDKMERAVRAMGGDDPSSQAWLGRVEEARARAYEALFDELRAAKDHRGLVDACKKIDPNLGK